jgi:prepilin-type N-terminal cleavage/methylation domain-containing protein
MRKTRQAFTIVELLVVITIIGLLMALLLPAVSGARARAREIQCTSQQRGLAQGLIAFASSKGYFPGRLSDMRLKNQNVVQVNWPVRLLPNVDGQAIYDQIQAGTIDPSYYHSPFVCPSDPPASKDRPYLSYAANTGTPDTGNWLDLAANGICHNLSGQLTGTPQQQKLAKQAARLLQVSLDSIKDGLATTILTAENVDAGDWMGSEALEGATGIMWSSTGPGSSEVIQQLPMNQRVGEGLPDNAIFARPSSRHNGIVVVAFCDGRAVSLSNEIDMLVYARLMTPDGRSARGSSNQKDPYQHQLVSVSETDLQK